MHLPSLRLHYWEQEESLSRAIDFATETKVVLEFATAKDKIATETEAGAVIVTAPMARHPKSSPRPSRASRRRGKNE